METGWMRVREAAGLMGVSESTVRRRIAEGELRGRAGKSGRQEVFLPAKLRQGQGTRTPATAGVSNHTDVSNNPSPAMPRSFADAPVSEDSAAMIKRYERLAGGSLMLAQQRADELNQAAAAAYENLAHARQQLRQVRKVALAGWGVGVFGLLLAFVLSLAFGLSSARSQGAADASRQAQAAAEAQAQKLREQLAQARAQSASDFDAQASVPTD